MTETVVLISQPLILLYYTPFYLMATVCTQDTNFSNIYLEIKNRNTWKVADIDWPKQKHLRIAIRVIFA